MSLIFWYSPVPASSVWHERTGPADKPAPWNYDCNTDAALYRSFLPPLPEAGAHYNTTCIYWLVSYRLFSCFLQENALRKAFVPFIGVG
jgi:hypothetical protein